MRDPDREAALRANVAAYSSVTERAYVNGAPHLKHRSIDAIYRSLVDQALVSVKSGAGPISVLELGAGSGLASTVWFERKVNLTAVDSSREMLDQLNARAQLYGARPTTIADDVLDYLDGTAEKFDIVTHVSMLHHIPDYLDLLVRSASHVRTGGCLLTFQDPLRYDRLSRVNRISDRAGYFAWRAFQGNLKRGLKTRWRRLRGVYSADEVVDFDEYHVVRNGVDSAAIVDLLKTEFSRVESREYWSTYSRGLQRLGERLNLKSSFGILATDRKRS